MRIAQETALEMEERFRRHHDFWQEDVSQAEEDVLTSRKCGRIQNEEGWSERLRAVLKGRWKLKKEDEDELKTWQAKAYRKDEARKEGKSEKEVEERTRALTGKRRREWRLEVTRYKKWKQDPYYMVTKLLYSKKRTADGGRDFKRKVERLGEEVVVKKFKLDYPSLEYCIEEGLEQLCSRHDPNPHGNLVPKLATSREAGCGAKRTKLN